MAHQNYILINEMGHVRQVKEALSFGMTRRNDNDENELEKEVRNNVRSREPSVTICRLLERVC